MILAADIGGTNARIALFERAGGQKPFVSETYRTSAWDGVPAILREFLATHQAPVTAACVAVAGPVHAGRANAINLPWAVDQHEIARALDLPEVALVNDLAANARGVAVLSTSDLYPLNAGDSAAAGNRVVVSAGTGLGEAALLWDGAAFRAIAGEGGHADFAPRTDAEIGLLRYLAADYGHVSYERVCSGNGLVNIYRYLRSSGSRSRWFNEEGPAPSPAAIFAEANADPLCLSAKAVDMFSSIYGARAGNVALSFMATGGVYLAGGIAPRMADKLAAGGFLRSFADKGRLSALLSRIPVFVILDDQCALRGARDRGRPLAPVPTQEGGVPPVIAEPYATPEVPELVPDDHVIVLFGATGDLARRKLLPGLFRLAHAGLLPERYRIVATSRTDTTTDGFRTFAREALEEFGKAPADEDWRSFAENVSYSSQDVLADAIGRAHAELGDGARTLYYLSVPPVAFAEIIEMLGTSGLADGARVILEKPFGTDLDSARALNETVHSAFDEEDVFRIDHFLGKETVQNILALRFANGVFEPTWNRDHIEHVQIDVPETLSIGTRAAFYEGTGAYRDMIVTHLLQVLGFIAMEPPTSFSAQALLNETVKVAESMRPIRPEDVVYGQYAGYRDADGVAPDSQTETFVAAKVAVDNWRWAGVPFYLRTGKKLAQTRRVVTIAFRDPPRRMFESTNGFAPNELVFDLGDPGSISSTFLAKIPGPTMQLGPAKFTFDYDDSFTAAHQLEAYERLIHDALMGDRTLFTRADGIERLWEVSTPLLNEPPRVHPYFPGSWGPPAAEDLIAPRRWRLPEED